MATISVVGMRVHLALLILALAVSTLGSPVTTAIMTTSTVMIDVPQVERSTISSDTYPAAAITTTVARTVTVHDGCIPSVGTSVKPAVTPPAITLAPASNPLDDLTSPGRQYETQ